MSWFDLPKALRTALLADTAIQSAVGTRLHYQEIPQSSDYPHIWFTRTARTREDCIDGTEESVVDRFTFEVVSDVDAEAVVDALESTLRGFESDNVGGRHVQLVVVEDAEDDYVFRSVGEGEPNYLHALQVAVYSFDN